MQLAEGLAGLGSAPNVFAAVIGDVNPNERARADSEWAEAAKRRIRVVDGSFYRGEFTPKLKTLESASITHIIGHAHITGSVAKQLHHQDALKHTKMWQINHVLPREAERLKEQGAPPYLHQHGKKKGR
jgi:hypothetical protein